MKKLLICILLSLPLLATAQEVNNAEIAPFSSGTDSVVVLDDLQNMYAIGDTVSVPSSARTIDGWRPDPLRAVWMGTLVPGLGQIYNRSYWKLPIVYGGFMGCTYALLWNNTMYEDYKLAYRDIYTDKQQGKVDTKDPTKSYNAILPKGYTIERMGGVDSYTNTLNNKQNLYRRYRDISIVAMVAVYALSIIDAYVDAQLFDFDISPDLSFNVEPQIYQDLQRHRSAEIRLALTIK